MKKLVSISLLCVCLTAAGCSAQQAASIASTAVRVISGVLAIAQSEEAALPAPDAAVFTPWVNQGQILESQLNSCVSSATAAGSKSAAFAGCFNTFASGVLSPAELAGFHITSATTQAKVQTYVTIAVVAVNGVLTLLNSAPVQTPAIASAPASSSELLRNIAQADPQDSPIIEAYCRKVSCEPVFALGQRPAASGRSASVGVGF